MHGVQTWASKDLTILLCVSNVGSLIYYDSFSEGDKFLDFVIIVYTLIKSFPKHTTSNSLSTPVKVRGEHHFKFSTLNKQS